MRGLALLLCFATLVGFVPAGIFAGLQVNAVEVAAAPVNMVQNGTFDTDAESWTLINAAQSTFEVVDGVASFVSETVRDENGDVAVDSDGNKPGDWLEVPFYIEDSGSYEVKLTMGVSDGCCTIKATFDDEHTVENIDCSGLPEDFIDIDFGVLELEAGAHKVRMTVTDKGYDEDYEPGWYLINAGGIDLMRVGVEVPEANDLEVVNVIDNDSAIAGMIEYVDGKFDFLMFNRTAGGITVDKLITDAKQASVLGLVEGAITEGFAATGATAMSYDGKTLFTADKKVDVVASNTGWQVVATEAGTITLSAVAPERDYVITVNGEAVDAKIADGALTIALAAGENHIVVAEEAPVEDPTDPTQGTEATDPTDPGATEPNPGKQDGNDATLWIILAVVAVLAIGAVVAVVIIKKRKAT